MAIGLYRPDHSLRLLRIGAMKNLNIKIFADGADIKDMRKLADNPLIQGFTTNPTLMKKAGITNYRDFASQVLEAVKGKPVSFEVFADDCSTMERQAREISGWGKNVHVKIPVTTTTGKFTGATISRLTLDDIKVNVTAVMTIEQATQLSHVLLSSDTIISVFAGRIADTGVDPMPIMRCFRNTLPIVKLLWASPRELLNIFQAEAVGCDIITVPPEIIAKFPLVDKDLAEYSRETVQMFHNDAKALSIELPKKRARNHDPIHRWGDEGPLAEKFQ